MFGIIMAFSLGILCFYLARKEEVSLGAPSWDRWVSACSYLPLYCG